MTCAKKCKNSTPPPPHPPPIRKHPKIFDPPTPCVDVGCPSFSLSPPPPPQCSNVKIWNKNI